MAGLRLSTDIFSPIKSDFSNDESMLSFEYSAGAPEFEKHTNSLGNRPVHKGSSFKFFSKNTISEKDASSETILSDVKRQSDINAEKEEKCRNTYEQLKQPMDDLFSAKASDTDVSLPAKTQLDLESICSTENIICGLKTEEKEQTPETATENCLPSTSECISKALIRKSQENANKTVKDRKSSRVNKKEPHSKVTVKSCTNKVSAKDVKSSDMQQKSSRLKPSRMSSSSKTSVTTKEKKETQSLMNEFGNKKDVPHSIPNTENKAMSIEKSVQIAIGMQLDGIRCLMLDQNINLRKEMLILQEMARKQNETTAYLFSVVEDLLEANKKLISKCD